MKLGIDCRDLRAGGITGIGRFVGNVLHALAQEQQRPELFLYGNQHTVFTVPASPTKPLRVRTRTAPEAATWWWDRVKLPRMVRRDRLDVFLSPYYKAPGIRSCPIATTIHDLLFLRMPPEVSGRSGMYCRAFRSFAASFSRRAAVVLTVSEYSRRDIIELLDVPPEKTHVVGNCVGAQFHPVADAAALAAARNAYRIPEGYILYVGNFGPHKNVEGLLEAYARLDGPLRARHSLVLAGRPDKWAFRVSDAARRLRVSEHLRMPGHIAEEHLPALYAGAAAFVTLSRWEGFGLPVVEAMACGTPVLCSNRAALPEVAGDAALLVDPDDSSASAGGLARILADDALRAALRAKGQEQAARFSPHRFAELVVQALRAAMESRASGSGSPDARPAGGGG